MKLGKRGVEDRAEYDWSETEDETRRGWPWQKRRLAEVSASDDPEGRGFPDVDEFEAFEEEDEGRPRSWLPIALGVLLVGAFLFRVSTAEHVSSHIDEGASIMAAHAVAEKGVPIFPSGTLYLQGGTLSYILAPFVWVGYGDLDDLTVMRFPSVVAGTIAVFFMFLFGRFMTGSAATGYLGAVLLAFDPLSVRWSGHVRMYALLQMCTLCFLWLFFRAVFGPPNRRLLAVMVGVFWFSVFTHIATLLVWPGMVLCAFIVHGWSLRDRRRDLTIALGACLGAPFIMLMLNQLVEPPDQAVNQTVPGVSFVGDYFLSIRQILHPNIQPFLLLFRRTGLTQIMPYVMVGMTCLLLGRYFLVPHFSRVLRSRRRIVGLLLILYWLPIAFVTAFTTGAEERYLMHVQPVGFLLLAILVVDLVGWAWRRGIPVVPSQVPALSGSNGYAVSASADAHEWRPVRTIAPTADDDWSYERTKRPAQQATEEIVARPLPRTLALVGLAVIAIGGAILRLVRLDALSLWLDEGFTVLYSRLSWSAVLGVDGYYSPHPPLFFALVKAVADVIGDEYAARTISVVCAIATLPVFYAIASRLLDRRAGLVATAILAISPMNIYYAQEGRMYALLVFLVSLTYLALIGFWQQPRWNWAILYGVAGALAMWVDYSAVYVLLPQAIPLAMLTWKYRMQARPLFIAIAGAGVAYLPWVPRVFDTVSSANEETRRETYLGAQSDRVGNALLSIVGLGGDNSYFYGSEQAPWHRFPELRLLFILAFLPMIYLGLAALWRRRPALTVTGCLFAGTLIVAIVISQISPGFAERTVLSATLGWALLVGASFREGIRRQRLLIASGSLAVVVLASGLTLSALYGGAQKQDWRGAAQAVAETQPWGMPVVTYSYGAVADTLIDVYEPGLLGVMRHVTIRDGELENTLSGGVLREVGLTRGDLAAGKLGAVLPASDPTTGAVWYLYPPRTGEQEVHAAFLAQGYERVYRRLFDHPRYRIWLDLYVRPGYRLGAPITINGSFADGAAGWALPVTGASIVPDDSGAGGNQLVMTSDSPDGTFATLDLAAQGEGLYSVGVDVTTTLDPTAAQVHVTCLRADGTVLAGSSAEEPNAETGQSTAVTRRAVAWCPESTTIVRFMIGTNNRGDSTFRHATVDFLPLVTRVPESEQG